MPLFITQELINSSKTMAEGFSLVVIKEVKEGPSEKDPAWNNTRIFFEGITGPGNKDDNKGRIVTLMISGKALSVGVRDPIKNAINLICAAEKCKEEDLVGKEIDFKKLIGRKLWIEVKDRPDQGKIYQDVVAFYPDDIVPFN